VKLDGRFRFDDEQQLFIRAGCRVTVASSIPKAAATRSVAATDPAGRATT
jgi:hypothetical protein